MKSKTGRLPFTVIIPAYNEEKGIGSVIEEVRRYAKNVIVVDDGSKDGTRKIAEGYAGVTVASHQKNRGKVAAILTGVRLSRTDVVVTIDADHTYPASDIPKLVGKLEQGADLAIGNRFSDGKRNIPAFNRVGNVVFSFLISFASGRDIADGQTGFRAFRKSMLESLGISSSGLEFETEMTIKAAIAGYEVAEVPIGYRERIGKSKLKPFRDGYRMLFAIVRSAYSQMSLVSKCFAIPGIALLLVGLFFMLYSVCDYVAYGKLSHEYYPLIFVFCFLAATQLVTLAMFSDVQQKKLTRIERELRQKK